MKNIEDMSPLALAFLGDAIHTAYVRQEVLKGEKEKLNTYHTLAKSCCNARKIARYFDRERARDCPKGAQHKKQTQRKKF